MIRPWLDMISRTSSQVFRGLSTHLPVFEFIYLCIWFMRTELTQASPDGQRHEVLQWLERTNPSVLHNLAFKKHQRYTSAWLLKSPEWINWLHRTDSDKFLWIHGIPGAGKTVLASFIIEQLKQICNSSTELGYAFYYCHHSNKQDEAGPLLRWAISQLCRQLKWVPSELKELYDLGLDPSIHELESTLEAVLQRFTVCYIVIDAVDESDPRDDLISMIQTLVTDERFRNLRILATSRQYSDIERIFLEISTVISMANPLVEQDIREFVHARLSSSRRMKRWGDLLGQIEDILVAKAQGM